MTQNFKVPIYERKDMCKHDDDEDEDDDDDRYVWPVSKSLVQSSVDRLYAADNGLDKANHELALATKNTASALRKLNEAHQRSDEATKKVREALTAIKQAKRKLREGIETIKADRALNSTALSLASQKLLHAKQQLAAFLFELATLKEEDITNNVVGYLRDAEFNIAKFRERVESFEVLNLRLYYDLKLLECVLEQDTDEDYWDKVYDLNIDLKIMEKEKSKLKAWVQGEREMQREMLRRETSYIGTNSMKRLMIYLDLKSEEVVKSRLESEKNRLTNLLREAKSEEDPTGSENIPGKKMNVLVAH